MVTVQLLTLRSLPAPTANAAQPPVRGASSPGSTRSIPSTWRLPEISVSHASHEPGARASPRRGRKRIRGRVLPGSARRVHEPIPLSWHDDISRSASEASRSVSPPRAPAWASAPTSWSRVPDQRRLNLPGDGRRGHGVALHGRARGGLPGRGLGFGRRHDRHLGERVLVGRRLDWHRRGHRGRLGRSRGPPGSPRRSASRPGGRSSSRGRQPSPAGRRARLRPGRSGGLGPRGESARRRRGPGGSARPRTGRRAAPAAHRPGRSRPVRRQAEGQRGVVRRRRRPARRRPRPRPAWPRPSSPPRGRSTGRRPTTRTTGPPRSRAPRRGRPGDRSPIRP